MSYGMMEFHSQTLRRNVEFRFLIPDDRLDMYVNLPAHKRPMKTIYLLNGYSNSSTEWLLGGNIRILSDLFNLAIILPNGENSFYVNGPGTGRQFGDFIGKDLVEYTRKRFGLSDRKEDTFIGGISMGGYGALRNGFAHTDKFSKIIAMSPAYIIHEINKGKPGFENDGGNYYYYSALFGDLETVMESENSVEHLIAEIEKNDLSLMPEVFQACGTEDFLYGHNQTIRNYMNEHNVKLTYRESSGQHDFNFWNKYIMESFAWATGDEIPEFMNNGI